MKTQLENIIDIASSLILEGKATEQNAIQMAIQIDNDRILNTVEDLVDMRKGYVNQNNKTQVAFETIKNRVHINLSTNAN